MTKLSLFTRLIRACCAAVLLGLLAAPLLAEPVEVTVLESGGGRTVLQYRLGDVGMEAVTIAGHKYVQPTLGKESLMKLAGAPGLPNLCRSLIIPDQGQVVVNVLEADYYELEAIDVVPSKGYILRSVNPADVPYTFGDVYRQDAFFPGELAAAREPYILRDYRGVVLDVNPLQYNPVTHTLRVYTDLVVEVLTQGAGGLNQLDRSARSGLIDSSFRMIYRHHFINHEQTRLRYPPLDEDGDLLIICHDPWLPNLQPLVNHKNARGIPTTLVGVSTIGNNANSIRAYIQNAYNTTDLAFVLLVGDAAQVATPQASGGASDPTYSKVAGGDDYPDIIIGRFSAQIAAEVDTQVQRTITHETLPALLTEWFWKGTGVASNQGPGDDGEFDDEHIDNIRDDLLAFGYTEVDQIYDPFGTAAMVATALNEGRGIINYCGHGNATSWGSTGFDNGDINVLVNDNMLPFIVSVACNNGEFDNYNSCFAEAWLRAMHGSEPTGAIGCYASSISQYWDPPMEAQDAFNLLLVAEAYSTYGALCYAGSCSMMDDYPDPSGSYSGLDMFNTWNIFGDPSLRVAITCTSTGTITLDRNKYACDDVASILVTDCDLDLNPQVPDTIVVNVASTSEPGGEDVLLTELGDTGGQFAGTIALSETNAAGVLLVAEGDMVTATYIDEDDGQGHHNVVVTDQAVVDCTPPVISGVQVVNVEPREATIQFTTDEPARGIVHYGLDCGNLNQTASGSGYSATPTVTLTELQTNTPYYFAVEAEDEAGNLGVEGNCYSFATPEVPDDFTELFGSDNDLDNLSLTFTPNGSNDFYAGCVTEITSLPTNPASGTPLPLSDDDYEQVNIGGGNTASLYGVSYTRFYVGSNGYITFGSGDTDYTESLEDHFDLPRISGLFDDLNPSSGGTVSYRQLVGRVAVTWQNVPEYPSSGSNTFQIELFFDGTITISYLSLGATDGLAGLSQGNGLSPDYFPSNLSEMGPCGSALGDMNCDGILDAFDIDPFVLALTDPMQYTMQFPNCELMNADINGDGVLDAFDIDPFVELLTGG